MVVVSNQQVSQVSFSGCWSAGDLRPLPLTRPQCCFDVSLTPRRQNMADTMTDLALEHFKAQPGAKRCRSLAA